MSKSIVSENIRKIRLSKNETRSEFGDKIGCTGSAINNYEREDRTPAYSVLQSISDRAGITVDELISTELELSECNGVIKYEDAAKVSLSLFPRFASPKARNNKTFSRGLKLSDELINIFITGQITDGNISWRICECFCDAVDETGYPEAHANVMWIMFILWLEFDADDKMIQFHRKNYATGLSVEESYEYYIQMVRKNWKDRVEFLRELNKIFVEIIVILKHSGGEWPEVADYFSAMRYIFCMIDNNLSPQLNRTIGIEMMNALHEQKNKYAIKFYRNINWMIGKMGE